MAVEIKFCGLTRPEDAEFAAELGASYAGVILAGGPRHLDPGRAVTVLRNVPSPVRRVGVFAGQSADEIARVADAARLDVVQLHGEHDADRIERLRRLFDGRVWRVLRLSAAGLPADFAAGGLDDPPGDGLLVDSYVPGALGGTGVALPWEALAPRVAELRRLTGGRPIIVAGGLRPTNVARAIEALAPDVVDVSSGVESAPGIKDHTRMRVFRDAVSTAVLSA